MLKTISDQAQFAAFLNVYLHETNMKAMLEYVKTILQKVSFDTLLFRKELMKSIEWLTTTEQVELKTWLIGSFQGDHRKIIMEVFERKVA